MPSNPKDFALSPSKVNLFHEQGYLGPFPAVSPEEMASIREHIERDVLQREGPSARARVQSRHMDSKVVFDLCAHPAILDRMESLYGPHLILWASYFFSKDPGGKEIPWHQDLNYWPLEPIINISAWIALDDVKVDNSCVQIIPGSHKKIVPHVRAKDGMAFGEEADENYFSKENMVNMEMAPGEFFLFNEKLLHHSEPNRSNRRRMGMAVRVTIPIVKINHDNPPLHPGHAAILLRGEDYMGFNRMVEPPSAD